MTHPQPSGLLHVPPPPPDPDQEPEAAEPPGWAEIPEPPPGPRNPDDVPAGEPGPDGESGQRRSTRASTRPPGLAKVSADGLGEAMSAIFRGVGEALNHLTALDEQDDIWLATEEQADGVGEPLGRIIARRVPDLPGQGASDLADGIAAMIPAAIWLTKNGVTWLSRRRRRPRAVPGQVIAPDLAQPAAQQ